MIFPFKIPFGHTIYPILKYFSVRPPHNGAPKLWLLYHLFAKECQLGHLDTNNYVEIANS